MYITTIMGKITKKPELKTFKDKDGNDTYVTNFTLACRNSNDPNTHFVRVAAYRGAAETLVKYGDEGRNLMVIGPEAMQSYQKDGATYHYNRVNALLFEFGTDSLNYIERKFGVKLIPVVNEIRNDDPQVLDSVTEIEAAATDPDVKETEVAEVVGADVTPW